MHDADTLFWDLDGTLTDPYEGITRSVAYALHFFDIEVPDRTVLCPFIGPPLKDSFMRFYGFSSADAELAIARYRDYFAGKGLFENTVYPGIPSLLDALENAGRRHVLATSKPGVFAERILTHFGLRRYFSAVVGSDLDGKRVKKEDVLRHALELTNAKPARSLMIGDPEYDVAGARAVGMDCIGVTYGYGSEKELSDSGAVALADSPEALRRLLLPSGPF